MDCRGPSALAMTGVWGLGALSRALGSLPRPFNNKGIRHGKARKTPSLLGLHDAVIQAAPGFSETTKRLPRLSGLPRAFGPRNDEAGRGRPRGSPLARCTATGGRPYGDRVGVRPRACPRPQRNARSPTLLYDICVCDSPGGSMTTSVRASCPAAPHPPSAPSPRRGKGRRMAAFRRLLRRSYAMELP
jgi:hypothetical protein